MMKKTVLWLEKKPVGWLLPLAAILIFFYLYPIFDLIRISFTDASFLRKEVSYTLNSYKGLFNDSDFRFMLVITFLFVFSSVALRMVVSFTIALVIDAGARRGFLSSLITRTVVLMSWAIPGVIAGIVWKLLYNESHAGILTYFFNLIGIGPIPFLSSPTIALSSLVLVNLWHGTAFSMILFYAGLQTVPPEIVEAATIDGAGYFNRLFRIVIPFLFPLIMIVLIISTIGTFNTFDMIMSITGGGPGRSTEVIALNVYSRVFREMSLGRGSAVAVILLIINFSMAVLYYQLFTRRNEVAP